MAKRRYSEKEFVDALVSHASSQGRFTELYHGTSVERANKILKEGFRLHVHKQTMGGDPKSSRNYIWFAKAKPQAQTYAEMHSHPALITVRFSPALLNRIIDHGRNSGPVSVWSPIELPSKIIHSVEVKRGEQWTITYRK